jgi:hypothetical protein
MSLFIFLILNYLIIIVIIINHDFIDFNCYDLIVEIINNYFFLINFNVR